MNSTGIALREWQMWYEVNCCRCTRAHACVLNAMLFEHLQGHVIITHDYMARIGGHVHGERLHLPARCAERYTRQQFGTDLAAGKMHPPWQ